VAAGLAEAGLHEPERRPFRAHATVARLRAGARSPRPGGAGGPEPVAFAGEALTLYRSHLARAGARYEPVERIALG
jgi:2'-5' RNA ligase